MSLVSKFKDLFFEEEEIEEPVKTNDLKIEDKKELKNEEDLERDTYKSEPTFKFPVIFEEEDLKPDINTKKIYSFKDKKDENKEEKKFHASPIISPVYGILDKNYKREEILDKKENADFKPPKKDKSVDIDTVRQKAFGTLEEDLEHTILDSGAYIYGLDEEKKKIKEEKENDLAKDMGLSQNSEKSVGEVDENYKEYGFEFKKEIEIKEKLQKTEVLDDELFELVNKKYKEDK